MLVKSHFEENNEKFNTIALQIAAHEAKNLGHTNLANDIRKIIDASKTNKPKLKNIDPNLQTCFFRNISSRAFVRFGCCSANKK